MKTRSLTRGAMLLAAATFAGPAFAAGVGDDCRSTPPPDPTSDTTLSDNTDGMPAETLTDRLATCGSVLEPPKVGDPDIVEPTPPVGDDINIHPDAPAARP